MFGGTIFGFQACQNGQRQGNGLAQSGTFSDGNKALLNEIGETIIPATDSGGAKAANVADFMETIVNDFYTEEEEKIFASGIPKINQAARNKYGGSFMELSGDQREGLLLDLEDEVANGGDEKHYYVMMKQLTVWGYLTSEVAAKEAFKYSQAPGQFNSVITYNSESKAMFPRAGRHAASNLAQSHNLERKEDMRGT